MAEEGGQPHSRIVKVDIAMLLASRGKFARIYVEVNLDKPLMAIECGENITGYNMRGYMTFASDVGSMAIGMRQVQRSLSDRVLSGSRRLARMSAKASCSTNEEAGYGKWTIVQRNQRRSQNMARGNMGNSVEIKKPDKAGGDLTGSKQNSLRRSTARVSLSKDGVQSSSTMEIGRNKGTLGTRSTFRGSRFTRLNDTAEEEDMDVEGVNVDINIGGEEEFNALSGPGSSTKNDKGQKQFEEEVVVAVSHPSIGEGLAGYDLGTCRCSLIASQRLMNSRA